MKDKPVTPGVILLECMGQIGLISHLFYLYPELMSKSVPVFSHAEVDFLNPVFPDTDVVVEGVKLYFRKNIMKSKILMMKKSSGEIVARCNGSVNLKSK